MHTCVEWFVSKLVNNDDYCIRSMNSAFIYPKDNRSITQHINYNFSTATISSSSIKRPSFKKLQYCILYNFQIFFTISIQQIMTRTQPQISVVIKGGSQWACACTNLIFKDFYGKYHYTNASYWICCRTMKSSYHN